jgi:hypothetical protein
MPIQGCGPVLIGIVSVNQLKIAVSGSYNHSAG